MKKKTMIALTSIFVVAALAALLLFVFSGDSDEPVVNTPDLSGTWKVTGQIAGGVATHIDNEFYVFTGDTASNYRDGSTTPYATSSYTLTPGTYPDFDMELPDLGLDMVLSPCTDNLVRLYTNASLYVYLYRYPNADFSPIDLDVNILEGSWDVAYRYIGDTVLDEQLVFENGELRDYRNGSKEPTITAPYTISEEGHLCVDSLGMETRICPTSEDLVFLIEVDTGNVWELRRLS